MHRLALPLVVAVLGVTKVVHGFLASPALRSCKASRQGETQTIAAASGKQLGQQVRRQQAVAVLGALLVEGCKQEAVRKGLAAIAGID